MTTPAPDPKPGRARPPRRLIVCCDGTNNTLTAGDEDTNVLRLFQQLAAEGHPHQVLYYDPGVGSPDTLPATGLLEPLWQRVQRLVALAVGRGIYENIAQAYLFLCREHRVGDEIWLFGFSRGAFTVRSVAGMVNLFGLLRPELEPMMPTLLRVYFAADERNLTWPQRLLQALRVGWRDMTERGRVRPTRASLAEQIRRHFASDEGRSAWVHFTGVWDTVESVGIRGLRKTISSKSDLDGKRFRHVRHALSLDEHRYTFLPRYYTVASAAGLQGRTLQQAWFRGVHTDVGGGGWVRMSGLSDVALDWMVEQARALALDVQPLAAWPRPQGDPPTPHLNDQLHATPWWAVAGMALRRPAGAPGGNVPPAVLDAPFEHPSVALQTPSSAWARWRSWWALGGVLLIGLACLWRIDAASTGVTALPGASGGAMAWLGSRPGAVLAAWQSVALLQPQDALAALQQAHRPRAALAWDLGFIACWAYVLARLASRAFASRARWRRVHDPIPWWNVLGRALPLAVAADLAENALGLAALTVAARWPAAAPPLLALGGLASAAKWAGLGGVALLTLIGWRGRLAAR